MSVQCLYVNARYGPHAYPEHQLQMAWLIAAWIGRGRFVLLEQPEDAE